MKNLLDYNSPFNTWVRNNRIDSVAIGFGINAAVFAAIGSWIYRVAKKDNVI